MDKRTTNFHYGKYISYGKLREFFFFGFNSKLKNTFMVWGLLRTQVHHYMWTAIFHNYREKEIQTSIQQIQLGFLVVHLPRFLTFCFSFLVHSDFLLYLMCKTVSKYFLTISNEINLQFLMEKWFFTTNSSKRFNIVETNSMWDRGRKRKYCHPIRKREIIWVR